MDELLFKEKAIKDIYQLGSIVDIVKQAQTGENTFPNNIDVVIGGFPCQDFSVAGKRKGFFSDKSHTGMLRMDSSQPSIENRGNLYMWMREVIALTKPKLFIAENVKGLVNLNDAKDVIQEDFRSVCNSGYIVVNARVLHAANYGVPQSRERVLFFGFLKSALRPDAEAALCSPIIPSEYDPYPPPTHFINGNSIFTNKGQDLLPAVSAGKALQGLPEPNNSIADLSQKSYSGARWMGRHCQGQNEIDWNGLGPTIRSEHHGNIEFRRLSLEHGGVLKEELNSGLSERRLTVRECARIQTFPDDYEFVMNKTKEDIGLSTTNAYKLIGNAVPPLLGYHVANRIEYLWPKYFGEDC